MKATRTLISVGLLFFTAAAQATEINIAGSSTIQPLAEVVAQAYERTHSEVRINVQGGGSSVGISAPQKGLAEIGTVSRALHPDEAAILKNIVIALDGIAMIAHAKNPVRALTKDQVVAVYTGVIRNWKELGGKDLPITVVNKEEGRSTLELFEQYFGLKGKVRQDAIIIGPNGQAITTAAGDEAVLAYVSIGSALVAKKGGAPIKLLDLDGVKPSLKAVRDESYPLRRPLNLVTFGPVAPVTADLLQFFLSKEGQALAAKEDFVPVAGR